MISNKTIMEVGNITKASTFKSFLNLSYKNTQLLFSVTVVFNIFMRQTLNDFWRLHKNMNYAFPLTFMHLRYTKGGVSESLSVFFLFIYLLIHLFVYLFIYSSIYLFVYLFICLFIYLFIYLFQWNLQLFNFSK